MQSNGIEIYANSQILSAVESRLALWKNNNTVTRVWNLDPTVWKNNPEDNIELSNRLGWLNLPSSMQQQVSLLETFALETIKYFDDIVLLGMGGSSLAPEVFFKTFGKRDGYPGLIVLDSTHPLSVRKILDSYNLDRTLFIVSSKSGGTTETMSFFYTFYDALSKKTSNPGKNFIAITDKGSGLEKLAKEKNFRKIFTTPSEVGGRYSALTFFGLVPAALIGADLSFLLSSAEWMEKNCSKEADVLTSEGFRLGALLGEFNLIHKNKITFFVSPQIFSFPAWIEQLIAESTGKEGKGIVPIAFEPAGRPSDYGNDRVFVYLRLKNDDNLFFDDHILKLKNSEFPVITINLENLYDLGKEIYRWEIATAMAGSILEINPFDQPNVQLAKSLANESMEEYKKTGKLPIEIPVFTERGISYFGDIPADNLKKALPGFLSQLTEGNYLALMAFIPFSEDVELSFNKFKIAVRKKYHTAVTSGYGPRFLHSTGQLHKGDGNEGMFIQLTTDPVNDLEVPGRGYSYGTLITAQAQGDLKALKNNGRRVIRFHLSGNLKDHIDFLTSLIN
jgi:glucose-6-phosphate isomerase